MLSPRLKLLLVAGARPNFVKIAPLIKALHARNKSDISDSPQLDWRLVHTGQHYDHKMSGAFFSDLDIPNPEINLEVGSGTHAAQTANVMLKFEPVCESERPDWVVVVGDVNSTVACTLVASKLGIKVAHIEAGLRSFDRTMPEETNRLVTDSLADLHFTPSQDADGNLKKEGVDKSKIKFVGNIMIDALVSNLEKVRSSRVLHDHAIAKRDFAYVTLHRPSNVDDRTNLTQIMTELTRLARRMPVVFPMHPRTRKMCLQFAIPIEQNGQLRVVDPLGYHDSLCLTENARLVLTDSGGLQEETTYFRTPCLTLRPNTERPITISVGSNRLTTSERLGDDIDQVLEGPRKYGNIPPRWDGKTAQRIVNALAESEQGSNQTAAQTAQHGAVLAC